MKEKIRKHIDALFTTAPKTRKAMELKEEVTRNTIDKFEDLISEGYAEEDAFQNVINSIGDVTELFPDLEDKNLLTLSETDRKKKAMLTAIAVGLYILAGVTFFTFVLIQDSRNYYIGNGIDFSLLGLILAAAICIAPTCMLVYAANMYPSFHKKEDNLVESFKEARYTNNKAKAIRLSVSLIIWTLILSLYFIISFITMYWHVTWVIFLIGGCLDAIAMLVFSIKKND